MARSLSQIQSGNTTPTQIRIPPEMLATIDKSLRKKETRSAFIRESIRQEVARRQLEKFSE